MKRIQIINGPNLNLVGQRETAIYGTENFETYIRDLRAIYPDIIIDYFQSNIEGEIIDQIHKVGFVVNGIIINAGAYTHTSIAIADAIAAVSAMSIEVHLSNVYARESYRHTSYLSPKCKGTIGGLGMDVYRLGIEAILHQTP